MPASKPNSRQGELLFVYCDSFIQANYDPSVSGEAITLNCLILGGQSHETFGIEIAKTADIGALKKLIKAENSPDFDKVAAHRLKLWKVSGAVPQSIR